MPVLQIAEWEHLPANAIAFERHYSQHEVLPLHTHERHQLLFAASGMMAVTTAGGHWIVPGHQAVWIPAGIAHSVNMLQAVTTCSLYVREDTRDDLPANCEVKEIRPLVRHLLVEASQVDFRNTLSEREERLVSLLLAELPLLPTTRLGLPLPAGHPLLRQLCENFFRRPDIHQPMDEWIERLHVSRRTFSRHFQKHTGMTFSDWIQLATLIHALPRIGQGEAVSKVALDIGFEHASAFSLMCKRLTGYTPSHYQSLTQLTSTT